MEKIILCNRPGHGNACWGLGAPRAQTWDMDAEFAAGFIYLFFIFGSMMVKIIKCI